MEDVSAIASADTQSTITNKISHNEEAKVKDLVSMDVSSSESIHSDNINDEDGDDVDDPDISDYDDNDEYMYDDDDDDDDDGDDCDYMKKLQAQFDNDDLPPGVEASVSWVPNAAPSESVAMSTSASDSVSMSTPTSSLVVPHANVAAAAAASSSTEPNTDNVDDVMLKYKNFKRFDIVSDFSDHHFIERSDFKGGQAPKPWTKKIQDEWKILEKDLPDTIYVRVYETRMDLLRAVIVGPAGTPYHDGLFVFDVLFPHNYPDVPPMVYYYSGGLRLNPNLYDCGKVCLSLLNTWNGKGNEKWVPNLSTMLQVLVSIQALILNANPFFNEPGFERMSGNAEGRKKSSDYNQNVFILSLKTMTYTIRRPPMYFEDLVSGHFRSRARDICIACRAYMNGAEVGSLIDGRSGVGSSCSGERNFKESIGKVLKGLVGQLIKNGARDLEEFLNQG